MAEPAFAERVLAHLHTDGYGSDVDPGSEPGDQRFVLDPPDGPWPWALLLVLRNESQQAILYAARPEDVPRERRSAVAEAITRANYGLVAGNFELDLDDGELRFKLGAELDGTQLSGTDLGAVLDRICLVLAATLQGYVGAIETVVEGADPSDAIDAAEQEA